MSRGYNTRAYVSNAVGAFDVVGGADFAIAGAQDPLPSIAASSTADVMVHVANASSQWKVQKTVHYMRSDSLADPAGIIIGGADCIQPVYPGTATIVATGVYMVMNGYLFKATTGGTTAVKFIGFANFNTVKGATTTDGTVIWTSFGKAAIIRLRFANVGLAPATPTAQTYEFFQF